MVFLLVFVHCFKYLSQSFFFGGGNFFLTQISLRMLCTRFKIGFDPLKRFSLSCYSSVICPYLAYLNNRQVNDLRSWLLKVCQNSVVHHPYSSITESLKSILDGSIVILS